MADFRAVLLLFLCRLPLASSCIPTVTPDDMYEDEMEATTSVLLTTSQATAEPTTTSTTTTTTTTAGVCPPSWVFNPANNFCYMLIPGSADMVNNAKCDAVVTGATLASIHDADENEFISYLVVPSNSFAFIGGYSPTGILGTWYWTDGTMYGPYDNWNVGAGYPMVGLNCMTINGPNPVPGSKWYNFPCDNGFGIVCMIAAT